MNQDKKSNGCVISFTLIFFVIILLYGINRCNFDDNNNEETTNYTRITADYSSDVNNTETNKIEDTVIKKHQWKNAGDKLMSISKIMIANNISGCGEFYISEITSNEFAVACTSDGSNWTYYVVYPSLDKIYLANDKMIFEPPY